VRNKTPADSNLYAYETFCLGDEKTGTITGRNVSYASRHSFNMRICGMQIDLWKMMYGI
jgi:hypothetical protein